MRIPRFFSFEFAVPFLLSGSGLWAFLSSFSSCTLSFRALRHLQQQFDPLSVLFLIFLFLRANRNAYNMVLHKYGDRLYSGLRDVVNSHLREVADQVVSVHDDQFLDQINTAWNEHKVSMLMIRDILMYMVRALQSQVHCFCFSIYNF